MDGAIRVLLVEDHDMVREGLKSIQCDAALVDLDLPDRDGVWCTRAIKEIRPGLPVVILTMYSDPDSITRALEAGADGYIIKSARVAELLDALTHVMRGGTYLHPSVTATLVGEMRQPSRPREPTVVLTDRERDVLALIVQGLGNAEIGERMCVSLSTVKSHVRALFGKLNVKDRTQLVIAALNRKLL